MYMYLPTSSVITNCKYSIGGFPVGVNWVLGRALVFILIGSWGGLWYPYLCVVGVLGFAISKLLVRGYA